MNPTRTTQPYRSGRPRVPGETLYAMLRGRDQSGFNPQDPVRLSQKRARAGTLNSLLRR